MRRLLVLALAAGLSGCSAAATLPGLSPTASPTAQPTPVPTANLAPLTFGSLSYTSNGCWTQIHDAQGHLIGGAEIDVSVAVTNKGTATSDPVWLIVQPANVMGPDLTWLTSSPLKGTMMIGPGVAFQGPPVPPGKSATLKVAVFFQTAYRADYSVSASVAPTSASLAALDAGAVGRWPGLWASVSVC